MLTYTNHSVDQFLEDLLDIGIDSSHVVRLGSKFTPRTQPLTLRGQKNTYKMSGLNYTLIQDQKSQAEDYHNALQRKLAQFKSLKSDNRSLMDYLEFSEYSKFFDAFTLPEHEDGMTKVGKRGKSINQFYLLDRWCAGDDAGVIQEFALRDSPSIWEIRKDKRQALQDRWFKEIVDEYVLEISNLTRKYDMCQERLGQLFNEKISSILATKRIIGCTTTAAAKYIGLLRKASPGIVLVEEAGEIL